MQRIAFIMHLNDEADAEEYKRRHDEIWPEMLDALRKAGIHNYSIYRQGTTLFAYLECEDFQRMAATLRDDPLEMYLSDVWTIPANMAGIPGVAIPCGFAHGLPVSLQVFGPAFGEATILRAAHAYEQSTEWHRQWPPIESNEQ